MPPTTRTLTSSVYAFSRHASVARSAFRFWRRTCDAPLTLSPPPLSRECMGEGRRAAKTLGCIVLACLLAVLPAGCKSNDLVEAQLRARDNDLRELREELERI